MADKNDAGTRSIRKKIAAWNRLKTTLPALVGNLAVTQFKESFRKQAFADEGAEPWKPRKINKTKRDSTRGILIKTGNLRNSIILKSARWPIAQVLSDTPYSVIHNYGGDGLAWGKNRFRMPRRKFMGQSNDLDKRTILLLRMKINRVFGI
jgi:phage gpG-like protein